MLQLFSMNGEDTIDCMKYDTKHTTNKCHYTVRIYYKKTNFKNKSQEWPSTYNKIYFLEAW